MLVTRREFLLVLTVLGLTGTRARARQDSLAVVTHPSVGISRLNDEELEAIFLTNRHYWSGTRSIIPFNLPPHSEERVYFDQVVLRMDPDSVARFWLDRRVRSGSPPPRQAPDPAMVARLVAKLEGAIGYVPESLVAHDVRVVARIRNGKVLPP